MTKKKMYIHGMKFLSVPLCILSANLAGGLWVLLLFVFSFILVHTVKLAIIGYEFYKKSQKKDEEEPPTTTAETNSPPPALSPIYYLVEKKRVKRKPEQKFEEPKKINFER
jgi:hypothetical protein